MTSADVLRGMTAPVSVQALNAGADALDEVPRLQATVAGLELTQADLTARLEQALADARPVVPETYTVQSGDYLLKIGRQFLVQVADIMAWNRLATDVIQPGQVLYMTGPAPETEPTPEPEPEPVPEPEPEPVPAPPSTLFSFDISSLGTDANITEAKKLADHKALFGVDNVQNVRVFFGTGALSWSNARIAALTDKDSVLVSFNTWNRAAFRTFLANTPERLRQRPGQVKVCFKHEFEAEWRDAADRAGWLRTWLQVHVEIAEELDASPWATQSRDDVVKILLWYSQMIDGQTKGTWRQFYGGQNFGYLGMDCYHYQVWLNNGRYATPAELFGLLVTMKAETGLPVCAPEWGGEDAEGDSDGTGRAKAITDGGAYCKANGISFANFWCAMGSKDAATGLPRDHHVEQHPATTAALAALIQGA